MEQRQLAWFIPTESIIRLHLKLFQREYTKDAVADTNQWLAENAETIEVKDVTLVRNSCGYILVSYYCPNALPDSERPPKKTARRLVQILKSKIHNVEVVACDPDYIGSIEIPIQLMKEVGLLENELVHVWAMSHKARIQTYVIMSDGPGVTLNGGTAHYFSPGDRVVIASFQWVDPEDNTNVPKVHIIE